MSRYLVKTNWQSGKNEKLMVMIDDKQEARWVSKVLTTWQSPVSALWAYSKSKV